MASKAYTHKKTGKRRSKKLLYVVWKVRLTPSEIRETYRTRFGIETSYRQMNEEKINGWLTEWSRAWSVPNMAGVVRIQISRRLRRSLGRCHPAAGLR